jgi:outer membrane protein OmpA-like peptidoglycan-associated protein
MPQSVANKLQTTAEDIHSIFAQELNSFNGDPSPFIDTEQPLRDCLMAELKATEQANKKRPWMAWTVALFILAGGIFLGFNRWQVHQLLDEVNLIDQTPGILVTHADTLGFNRIKLEVLRDPAAQTVHSWFEQHGIDHKLIEVKENAYLSLDWELIKQKAAIIIAKYSGLQVNWLDNRPQVIGSISNLNKLLLQNELTKLVGLGFQTDWLNDLVILGTDNQAANDPEIIKAILNLNIAKIDRVSIAFEPGKSELSTQAIEKLIEVKDQFNNLITLAEQQELSIGLIIMGASDTIGSAAFNKILSQRRADTVKLKLQELGITSNRLNAIGLGVIDLKTSKEGARKVLFNVIYFEGD